MEHTIAVWTRSIVNGVSTWQGTTNTDIKDYFDLLIELGKFKQKNQEYQLLWLIFTFFISCLYWTGK